MLRAALLSLLAVAAGQVRGPPRAARHTTRTVARLGENLRLKCPVHGFPAPIVSWQKDEAAVNSAWPRYRTARRSLRIRSLQQQDTGVFVCRGVNGFGKAETRMEVVVVDPAEWPGELPQLAAPVFTKATVRAGKDLTVQAGGSATLSCAALGLPEPRVSWYRDGELFREAGQQLELAGLQTQDSGVYSCVAQNMVGSVTAGYRVTVRQRPGEEGEEGGVARVVVRAGEEARLDCRVRADSRPTVQWLRRVTGGGAEGGAEITVGAEHYRILPAEQAGLQRTGPGEFVSQLAVPSARPTDAGLYICFVTSGGRGFNFQQAELVVAGAGRGAWQLAPPHLLAATLGPALALLLAIGLALACCSTQRRRNRKTGEGGEVGAGQHRLLGRGSNNNTGEAGAGLECKTGDESGAMVQYSLEESGALQSTLHCTGPLHSTLQQQPDPHAGYDRSVFTYFPPSGPGEQGRLYTETQN